MQSYSEVESAIRHGRMINLFQDAMANVLPRFKKEKWASLLPALTSENLASMRSKSERPEYLHILESLKTILEPRGQEDPGASLPPKEDHRDDTDDTEPRPKRKSASTTPTPLTAEDARELFDEMRQYVEVALATRHNPQPVPPLQSHTRDISRWRAAFLAGQLPALANAWLAGALRTTAIGTAHQTNMKSALIYLGSNIEHVAAHSALSEESWTIIEPMALRALAHEAAAEIYLRGGLSSDFVPQAALALVCEGADMWSGTPSTISRHIDEVTRPLQLAHKPAHTHTWGGRSSPRYRRASGGRPGRGH